MGSEFYSGGGYYAKHPDWHTGEAAWKAGQVMKMLSQHHMLPQTVCEIGCGAGEILHRLKSKMPSTVSFTGFEVSPQAMELAQSRAGDRLQFMLLDVKDIPASPPYDLCLLMDVMEHVEDVYGFLRESSKKAGHFIFHIPLDLSAQTVLRGKPLIRKRRNVGHLHYFTRETALALLEETGFKVMDCFYTGSYTDLPVKTTLSSLAKYPRMVLHKIAPDLSARLLGGYSILVLAQSKQSLI